MQIEGETSSNPPPTGANQVDQCPNRFFQDRLFVSKPQILQGSRRKQRFVEARKSFQASHLERSNAFPIPRNTRSVLDPPAVPPLMG